MALSKIASAAIQDASVAAADLAAGAAAANLGSVPLVNGVLASGDFNNFVTSGAYRIGDSSLFSNIPTGAGGYGQLLVIHGGLDTITQIYGDYSTGSLFTRSGNPASVGGGGGWSAWHFSNSIGTSGQAWSDVTGSRAGGTTYTNSTGKPIAVFIQGSNQPSNGNSTIYVNGVAIGGLNNYGTSGGCMFIVPTGGTYSISFSGSSLLRWSELR